MKSMKNLKSEHMPMACSPSEPEYPYGLRLCLTPEVVKALGFTDLPEVGKKMKLEAMVEVCRTEKTDTKEGQRLYMDLQITDLDLGGKKDPGKKLYAKES